MKKFYNLLILFVFTLAMPQVSVAAEWNYDFEDIESLINNRGPREAIEANFNGLNWHLYGAKRNMDDQDWCNGTGSLCLNGTLLNSSILATETPNITLTTARPIGTFSFYAAAHDYWKSNQVWWIVQYSTDGNTWITTGEPFVANANPEQYSYKINQPSAYVRIVREDYATYDYTSGTGYEFKANFDDFKITDYDGTASPILSASVSSLDFGELNKGEEATRSFTLTHKNITDGVAMNIIGDDAVYFTLLTDEVSSGETTEISIKCVGKRKGNYHAVFQASTDGIQLNLSLTAVGVIDDDVLFSGGEGTEDDPYIISDASDMQTLSRMVEYEGNTFAGKFFLMSNDINMASAGSFRPIGTIHDTDILPFSGTFDGGNHVLTNLSISGSGYSRANAIFGYAQYATIKNLTLAKSSITGWAASAGIVGAMLDYGLVSNCHVSSDVTIHADMYAAGIISNSMSYLGTPSGQNVRISDCTFSGRLEDFTAGAAGIICSTSAPTLIERCGNRGEVTSNNHYVAGICQVVKDETTIIDCYNTGKLFMEDQNSQGGTIKTDCRGGGIVASAMDIFGTDNYLTIKNCYGAGYMSETSNRLHVIYNAGEMLGENVIMTNNYYNKTLGNIFEDYAQGVEESVMKSQEFVSMLNGGTTGCWMLKDGVNNGYPIPESDNIDAIHSTVYGTQPAIKIENGKLVVNGDYDSIKVYDMNGRMQSFDNLTNGVYIIKVESAGKSFVKKIMR